jgi:GTP-binding protein
VDDTSFVAADIPGIIEGAHQGAGLGLQFLRHVQRTRALLHVVDASGTSGREPTADLLTVLQEVKASDPTLLERPQLVAATKRDVVAEDDPLPRLRAIAGELGLAVLPVSAVTGLGLTELKRALLALQARPLASVAVEGSA